MEINKKQIQREGKEAEEILAWLAWADSDYLAARMLFLDNLLIQGIILSNTAVEKYLKTIFISDKLKIPKHHEVPLLYRELNNKRHKLSLNAQYIELISKAYRLRYPDNLEPGYNIVLSQAKLLTELDSTVYKIRKRFNYQKSSGEKVSTRIDLSILSKDKNLFNYNYSFGIIKREEIFKNMRRCYELRILNNREIIEVEYEAKEVEDDGIFNKIALRPKS